MSYVLIVEDETDLAEILRQAVEDAGQPAKVCHDGLEAIELIDSPCGPLRRRHITNLVRQLCLEDRKMEL